MSVGCSLADLGGIKYIEHIDSVVVTLVILCSNSGSCCRDFIQFVPMQHLYFICDPCKVCKMLQLCVPYS